MSATKQVWVLTGGNGAGKSTFYRTLLEPRGIPFVNADLLARAVNPEDPEGFSYEASRLAADMRSDLLRRGQNFCFETVFSHPSKIDFLGQAKAFGYRIVLVYVHLRSTALNKARVAQRVEEGGHNVPDEKVEQRIPRTRQNVKQALPLCDQVHLLDNSRMDDPFQQVATLRDQQLVTRTSPLPDWAAEMLADYL